MDNNVQRKLQERFDAALTVAEAAMGVQHDDEAEIVRQVRQQSLVSLGKAVLAIYQAEMSLAVVGKLAFPGEEDLPWDIDGEMTSWDEEDLGEVFDIDMDTLLREGSATIEVDEG